MANKKFSEFELKTTTSNVSHIVGYNGAENVRITPANFLDTTGGPYLPLAGGLMVGNTTHNDNVKSIYGNPGNDLQIYHDGSASYISDTGTGNFNIQTDSSIFLERTTGENMAAFRTSNVELYYSGSSKFATTNTGISVTGDGLFTDTASLETKLSGNDSALNFTTASGDVYRIGVKDSDDSFRISKDATSLATNTRLTIDTNGNSTFAGDVNIGNGVTAAKKLIIDSGNPIFALKETDQSADSRVWGMQSIDSKLYFRAFNDAFSAATDVLILDRSGNSTFTGNVNVAANKYFNVASGSGTEDKMLEHFFSNDFKQGISALQDRGLKLFSKGAGAGKIIFDVEDSEKMRLDALGNLGLGTSSPNSYAGQTALTINSSGVARLDLDISNAVQGYLLSESGYVGLFAGSGNNLRFGSNGTEKMRLDASGNLGIKNSSPSDFNALGGNQVVIGDGTGTNTLTLYSDSTDYGHIAFGDSNTSSLSAQYAGLIQYYHLDDDMRFYTNSTEKMRISAGGNVLFGTTGIPNGTSVYGAGFINTSSVNSVLRTATNSVGAVNLIEFYNPNGLVGKIRTNGTATDYVTGSDYRLKEDLQDFAGLDLVSKIPVYDFKWKSSKDRTYGVMAHELQEVLPQAVSGDKDAEKMQGVDYSKIVPLLVKSIQELKAEIELLKNK